MQHWRPLTNSEQTFCSLRDSEQRRFCNTSGTCREDTTSTSWFNRHQNRRLLQDDKISNCSTSGRSTMVNIIVRKDLHSEVSSHPHLNLRHPVTCVQTRGGPCWRELKDLEHVSCQMISLHPLICTLRQRLVMNMGAVSTSTLGETPTSTTRSFTRSSNSAEAVGTRDCRFLCGEATVAPLFRGRSCRGGVCHVSIRCNTDC